MSCAVCSGTCSLYGFLTIVGGVTAKGALVDRAIGVSIKGHKTTYTTGCINVEETRSIGSDEIKRRIQTGHSSTYTELFTDTRRTEDESRSKSTSRKHVSTSNSKATKSTRSNTEGKDVVKLGANGNTTGTRKKRGDSELDTAIQRQRDFLNGFIKKD